MINTNYIMISTILLGTIGCSSSYETKYVGTEDIDAAGSLGSAGSAGTENTDPDSGTAGTNGSGGTAGINSGGSGNIDAGGTAGNSGTGGTSGTGSVGGTGTGGSAGTTQCVPKTCLTYAVERGATDSCGIIANGDGCGNALDCGGCDNPDQTCKGSTVNPDGTIKPGVDNICAGGCYNLSSNNCDTKYPGSNYYDVQCNVVKSTPPKPGCIFAAEPYYWCCPR